MGNIMDDWFGMDPPDAPKVPSAEETAALDQQFKLDALRTNISANRLDQSTPFMNISYAPTGVDQFGNTTYGVTTEYSPEQQALLEQLQNSQFGYGQFGQSLISDLFNNPIYNQGIPNFSDMMDPLMQRHLAVMDPYYNQQSDKLDADLRNQGLFPGMPGYDNAMRTLKQTQNESQGQFVNQSIPTVMAQYEQPLNIIQKIMSATGPVSMQNLGVQSPPTVNMGNTDVATIQKNVTDALMKQYEREFSQYADSINTIGSIAGTVLGAPGGTIVGNLVGAGAGGLANFMGLGGAAGTKGGENLPLFRLPTPVKAA